MLFRPYHSLLDTIKYRARKKDLCLELCNITKTHKLTVVAWYDFV